MIHLDLFSGIGGFAYAADQVFGEVEHIFCDNDPFCRQVLKKHWPESEIYDDIRAITNPNDWGQAKQEQQTAGDKQRDRRITPDTRRKHGKPGSAESPHRKTAKRSATTEEAERFTGVDLLTGGFPCQPFSAAGLRRGTSDDRFLWPEMLRVIRLTQPQWVIAENVNGLLTLQEGVVFEQVCTDLEAEGYEVQPFVIPAVAVNAPHRRDRIWFVAHSTSDRRQRGGTGIKEEIGQQGFQQNRELEGRPERPYKDDTNSVNTGLERQQPEQAEGQRGQSSGIRRDEGPDWSANWTKVATQFCSVDDGLPVELDGFKLSKPQHRAQQLKAYGNAIVPQVAMEIMRGMK